MSGAIVEMLPRRSQISRRSAGRKPVEQVIAANVDQMICVLAAANPPPRWGLLDRYLVEAELSSVQPILCITKMDLADQRALEADLLLYSSLGYSIVRTSAATGQGIDALREHLLGKLSVLVGKSGVGKTSLLNAIEPELGLRVGQLSASTGKGQHTTTQIQLIPLQLGGGLIDTPGVREFGLFEVEPREVICGFPEVRERAGHCRFGADCSHTHEPDCAVKQAVREGRVDPRRYRSLLKLSGHDSGAADAEARASNAFVCVNCGQGVDPSVHGTEHRNHCPRCLWSVHLDHHPGDRTAACGGEMEPIGVWVRPQGEWTILHRCRQCNAIRANRIASDDNELALMSLAVKPLANPPFPLDQIAKVETRVSTL